MTDADYFAVRVSTFRGDMKIPFNAYVRVAGKYILFCREGDSFEGNRLERLKSKKLQKMYIEKRNVGSYNDYVHENLNRAYNSSLNKPIEIRAQVIHGALQATTEDLMEDPSSQVFYKVSCEGALKFRDFFFEQPGCLKSMIEFKNTDFSVSHHGVTTSALTLAMAEEMNLHKDRALEIDALITGAMIHDIEHLYNNINFSVEAAKLSGAEQNIYIKHTEDGLNRLKPHPFYAPLITELVAKHEEMIDGSGPLKLRERELDPLIQVLATANHFDHYITYKNATPKEALKVLLIEKMGQLSLQTMKALQNALKKRNII